MNRENFANSPSGRLLKVGQGEIAYWAFADHHATLALEFTAFAVTLSQRLF